MIEILYTKRFKKDLKKLFKKNKHIKEDISLLIETLKTNPKSGTALGKSCYKIRVKDSSNKKGKSGGYRIITYLIEIDETLTLLTIYSKSERTTISDNEINEILDTIS
jgi:mRNA-degrading endonuclease RelE of RelBE toxin-antitoxin system